MGFSCWRLANASVIPLKRIVFCVSYYLLYSHFLTCPHRCKLDATTSHLRDDTSPPSVGYIVLVSGFLESDTKHALRINVESMYLVSTRSSETFASSSQAHRELTFSGKPNMFAFLFRKSGFLLIMLCDSISEGDNMSAIQARYFFIIIIYLLFH